MKVTDHLAQAEQTLFSFEILPPKKGESIDGIFRTVEALLPFNPAFIDVTYHATQLVETPDGRKVPIHKRPGTLGVCAAIKYKYGVDTVPHLICSGFSKDETEDALVELNFLGIDSVMALRGDPSGGDSSFVPAPGGHRYAVELIDQISSMNSGDWLHSTRDKTESTDFCIGAAGYPEAHGEAPDATTDLEHLKAKIDAGADFIVTQMFFDNDVYFRFVDRCRSAGINVPIIPGLKPLALANQIEVLPRIFSLTMPKHLVQAVQAAQDKASVRQIGIDWCTKQSEELVRGGAPCLHYYTMGKASATKQIAEAVFGSA